MRMHFVRWSWLLVLVGLVPAAPAAPGVRVADMAPAGGDVVVRWVARGGASNQLLVAAMPDGLASPIATVTPTGGVAPWFDVPVTSVVSAGAAPAFFRVAGPSLPAPSATPVLSAMSDQRSPGTVPWTDLTTNGAVIYQFQAAPFSNFASEVMETWPSGPLESVVVTGSTDLFCRVRAWNYHPEAGGLATPWSSSRVYRIMRPDPPVWTFVPSFTTQRIFTVTWTPPPLSAIHQVQHSADTSFSESVAETWPLGTQETVSVAQNDVRHFRVRSWSRLPEAGGVASDWSVAAACTSLVQLAAPVITNVPLTVTGAFTVGWTTVAGAAIYELRLANTSGVPLRSYWPVQPVESGIPPGPVTTLVARIRAWTALPEAGGEDGVWSAEKTIVVLP